MRNPKSSHVKSKNFLSKPIKIVVTAGPTRAYIDPVRYISNLSTGRMGYEIARQAFRKPKKFDVVLISGPTGLEAPRGIRFVSVETVHDLENAVMRETQGADILIMTAAVNDYIPVQIIKEKLRRKKNIVTLKLRRTNDIVARVAHLRVKPIVVGFSLETNDLAAYTQSKLKRKNLDLIVGNEFSKRQNPFGENKPTVLFINRNGKKFKLTKCSKGKIAERVLSEAVAFL